MFGRGECRAGDEKKTSKKRLTNVMGDGWCAYLIVPTQSVGTI